MGHREALTLPPYKQNGISWALGLRRQVCASIPDELSQMLVLRPKVTRNLIFNALQEAWCGEECDVQRAFLNQAESKVAQRPCVSWM